jgi:hypothetical protein
MTKLPRCPIGVNRPSQYRHGRLIKHSLMCAEHDGHVIAAAGYSEHATADGRG